jgi:hypothetical protein
MKGMLLTARKTAAASLFALVLLLGSALLGTTALGSPASAGEPGAVFYGYVVVERGSSLPKRVRAIADSGVVCGSAEVTPVGSGDIGFYAMTVFSADMREGCAASGDRIHFLVVHGMIDEGIVVGAPARFQTGDVTERHLVPAHP